jgi:hypothetical protein
VLCRDDIGRIATTLKSAIGHPSMVLQLRMLYFGHSTPADHRPSMHCNNDVGRSTALKLLSAVSISNNYSIVHTSQTASHLLTVSQLQFTCQECTERNNRLRLSCLGNWICRRCWFRFPIQSSLLRLLLLQIWEEALFCHPWTYCSDDVSSSRCFLVCLDRGEVTPPSYEM